MKTILVTGANSGIGKSLALEVIKNGGRLIAVCRQSKKSNDAYEEMLDIATDIKPIMLFGDLTNKVVKQYYF